MLLVLMTSAALLTQAGPHRYHQMVLNALGTAPAKLKETVRKAMEERRVSPLCAAQEHVRDSHKRIPLLGDLIEKGLKVDTPSSDGTTALMLAAKEGDGESVNVLLDYGADPLRRNKAGQSAVRLAELNNHEELADMLREYIGESGLRNLADYNDDPREL